MSIFLSYASEYRNLADRLAIGLRQEGFEVFFDRDQLPAGEGFDASIRNGIRNSQLFIFLISPESVSDKSYALTELGFARQKWKNPTGHVLPVFVAQTEMERVPAYLRAVTILEPQGDLVAEVLAEVVRLAARRRRRGFRWASAFLVAAAVAALALSLRPEPVLPQTCYLALQVAAEGGRSATGGEFIAHVTNPEGLSNSFFLADGAGPAQVDLLDQGTWSIQIADQNGPPLEPVAIRGCPQTEIERTLNATLRLIVRPR